MRLSPLSLTPCAKKRPLKNRAFFTKLGGTPSLFGENGAGTPSLFGENETGTPSFFGENGTGPQAILAKKRRGPTYVTCPTRMKHPPTTNPPATPLHRVSSYPAPPSRSAPGPTTPNYYNPPRYYHAPGLRTRNTNWGRYGGVSAYGPKHFRKRRSLPLFFLYNQLPTLPPLRSMRSQQYIISKNAPNLAPNLCDV